MVERRWDRGRDHADTVEDRWGLRREVALASARGSAGVIWRAFSFPERPGTPPARGNGAGGIFNRDDPAGAYRFGVG